MSEFTRDRVLSRARKAHLMLAFFVGSFAVAHLLGHWSALGGVAAHDATLLVGRMLYRVPVIEIVLIASLAVQVALGLYLLTRAFGAGRSGAWHWVQIASGAYLAYFIVAHTAAALFARLGFGLDTGFYWAAGSLIIEPLRYGFWPYYLLASTALFAHIAAALHFRGQTRSAPWIAAAGPFVVLPALLAFSGALFAFEIPARWAAYFAFFGGEI